MKELLYNAERFTNWLNTNSTSNVESVIKTIVVFGMLAVPILIVGYIE